MDISTTSKDEQLDDANIALKDGNTQELPSLPEAPTSFSDRVARLSISQENGANQKIISELRNSRNIENQSSGYHSPADQPSDKRRRRRSSAQSLTLAEKELQSQDSSEKPHTSLPNPREEMQQSETAPKSTKSRSSEVKTSVKKRRKEKMGSPISLKKLPGKPATLRDLRDSMLACLGEVNYFFPVLEFTNMRSIKKVIVLYTPGLQVQDFGLPEGSKFNETDHFDVSKCTLFKNFNPPVEAEIFPVSAPGSKNSLYPAYNHFLNKLLSKKDKKTRQEELSHKRITINDLLMSLDGLLENNFPIHPHTSNVSGELLKSCNVGQEAYLDTTKIDHDGSHIFALDCEMCLSAHGHVLTRVSMVDFDLNVVYDELVKPEAPITDYLTKYSGITEETLSNVTTTLEDVQRDILKLISEEDILIGHSFENDLNALKIRHPKIVDTSVIYEHKAGPPFRPALRYLTSTYLNYNIQTGEKVGHDSVEDAKACMNLVKTKIASGPAFGISVSTENIYERLSSLGARSLKLNENACRSKISNPDSVEASLRCVTDREVFDGLTKYINKYDFFVARMKGLALARGYVFGNSMRRTFDQLEKPSASSSLETLAQGIKEVYEASSGGTMIVIISGNGDTRQYSRIMAELEAFEKEDRTKARQERAQELEAAVSSARDAVAAVFFKQKSQDE